MVKARHYRGYGIHSPFVYNFIRNIVMNRRKKITVQIQQLYPETLITENVSELKKIKNVAILYKPFKTKTQEREFDRWFEKNSYVAIHLKECIVVFADKRLQKQLFIVRN
ncbi:MAG: hypothetical protein RR931_01160 [Mucinivorans sp.]